MFEEITTYLDAIAQFLLGLYTVLINSIGNPLTRITDILESISNMWNSLIIFNSVIRGVIFQTFIMSATVLYIALQIAYYIQTHIWLIFIVVETIIFMIGIITKGFLQKLWIPLKINVYMIILPLQFLKWLIELIWPDWL